jgi:hypothetical protein
LTTSMDDACRALHKTMGESLCGYVLTEKSIYEFNSGYAVTFLNYVNESGPG